MANEGSTKPTYSELEAENLRVRGLLQRADRLLDSWMDSYNDKRLAARREEIQSRLFDESDKLATAIIAYTKGQGAESADIGKLDAADKTGSNWGISGNISVLPKSVALAESSLSQNADSSAPTNPEATGLSVEPTEGRTTKETRNG